MPFHSIFFFYQKREDFGEIKLICRGIDKKIVRQKAREFYCTKMSTLVKYEIKLKVDGIGVPRLIRIQPK